MGEGGLVSEESLERLMDVGGVRRRAAGWAERIQRLM